MVIYETSDGEALDAAPDWDAWKSLDAYERGGDVVMVCRPMTASEAAAKRASIELAERYMANMELLGGAVE